MKHLRFYSILCLVLFFCSCSDDNYLNVIPAESTALVSVDVVGAASQSKGVSANLLKSLFRVSDVAECGLDLSAKVYLFETVDGTLGVAARVKNESKLNDWLNRLADKGICQKTQKRRDLHFTLLRQSWMVGFSDDALLLMGPVVATQQSELMRTMMRYLKADEGIKSTLLYEKVQSLTTPVAVVAQAQSLPQQLIAPFTIGVPTAADASQVMIAAEMQNVNGCLVLSGETFSFDASIDAALKNTQQLYRPLTDEYLSVIPRQSVFAIAMNANGHALLPLMRQSREFKALLTGVGMKIDIDNFIEQIDGDLVLAVPAYDEENMDLRWAAKLMPNRNPLDEASEDQLRKSQMTVTDQPLPDAVVNTLKGSQMAVMLNLQAVGGDKQEIISIFSSLLRPLFGKVDYIIYRGGRKQTGIHQLIGNN